MTGVWLATRPALADEPTPASGVTDLAQPSAPPPPSTPETPGAEAAPATAPETETAGSPAPAPTPTSAPADEIKPDPEAARIAEVRSTADGRIPAYQLIRPEFGLGLAASPDAFGKTDIAPAQNGSPALAFEVEGDYQPAILQAAGVFDVGLTLGIYPMTGNSDLSASSPTPSFASVWKVGGVVRYQARYFREQIIVPVVGYAAESLAYAFNDGTNGRVLIQGPLFGGMLLLNFLEPSATREIFVEQGVTRSYLLAELRTLAGSNANVTIGGASLFFGLRIEL